MIEVTDKPIHPEQVVNRVMSGGSGCVVTYIGLIREFSQGKAVLSVEYQNSGGNAFNALQEMAGEVRQRWPVNSVAISHRIGKLLVGDINLIIAVASTHREEGFAACQYAIDQFKQRMPTKKIETYHDSSIRIDEV